MLVVYSISRVLSVILPSEKTEKKSIMHEEVDCCVICYLN